MGKALYRKYRPKLLAEIIGQEHITDTLSNSLKQGTISHAYLFTGPRGVGKTSIARILAHQVNDLPYNESQPHLDIIEIDAASNRRIDEIRELKERVYVAPTSAKYKVYIIDEVHMLTKEAFNALLKTLEEPPDHAIFILATTEAHKVPETIISRTQRFSFKPVSAEKVAEHLKHIAKQERINIDNEALELIAQHGGGSFRDSISLLDQIRSTHTQLASEHVRQALGQAPDAMLAVIAQTINDGDLPAIADILAQLRDQGIQASQVAHQLSALLRNDILQSRPAFPPEQTLALLHQLAAIPAAHEPGVKLELVLYGAGLANAGTQQHEPQQQQKTLEKADNAKPDTPPKIDSPLPVLSKPKPAIYKPGSEADSKTWQQILTAVKAHHNTLYGIARMAVPHFESGKLTLTFAFAFHKNRLTDSKNQQALLRIIKDITGQNLILECVVDITAKPAIDVSKPKPPQDIVDLETISNIFGTAEVVE